MGKDMPSVFFIRRYLFLKYLFNNFSSILQDISKKRIKFHQDTAKDLHDRSGHGFIHLPSSGYYGITVERRAGGKATNRLNIIENRSI